MGVGLCVPAMHRLTIRWSVGPFPPRALPRFPGTTGRSDFPAPAHRHLGLPCADAPDPKAGPMVGSPGFRALPVPACRRLRPRWTRVRSRLSERSLLPSPPLPTGRRPRCRGFRGLSRSVPPIGGFRPTEFLSTLRPGRSPAQTQDSVPAREWLALVPVGLPAHQSVRESPTGKRRLGPAHATSPTFTQGTYTPALSQQ